MLSVPLVAFTGRRGRQTKEAIERSQKLAEQAPDFPWTHLQLAEIYNYPNFRDPAKSREQLKQWMLADLKGKVVLINLWATWCGPCRLELPYVQKLREQLKDRKDVMVLTLNIDQEVGMIEPFMKENKYSFPVLLGQEYAEGQGVNSIPRNWVVSFDGKVIYEGIGFGNDGEEWLKKATQMIEKVKGNNTTGGL